MTPSVRIASLVYGASATSELERVQSWQGFAQIQQVIRRHLPDTTASVFARPLMLSDPAGTVEWYSDLEGQPIGILDLPGAEQNRVRALLDDQLKAVSRLAQELERQDPDNLKLAQRLVRAVRYPGDESIYVIGGIPVLTSWGGEDGGTSAISGAAAGAGTTRWPRWMLSIIGLFLLGASVLGAWWWIQHQNALALRADLADALSNQCDPTTPLVEISTRLERMDPDVERYPDIRMAVLTEIGICDEGAALAEAISQARDCESLPAISQALAFYDLDREPFKSLEADLNQRIGACRRVQGLRDRLTAVTGNCAAVIDLDQEVHALEGQDLPLADLRIDLDRAVTACQLAKTLEPKISAAAGDCTDLRNLAREAAGALADHDSNHPPLAPIRIALDAQLARCDLADHLERELARAQDDCLALAGLKETLARSDPDGAPLAAVQSRLDLALEQCAVLSVLEQLFATAQGDCERLDALSGDIETYRDNLRFLDIRTRLRRELEVCGRASALEDEIASIGDDCAKARALMADLSDQGDPRFAKAHATLKGRILDCDRLERYTKRLAEASKDCTKLKSLEREIKRETSRSLLPVRKRLLSALDPCRPKPQPKVVVAPKPKPATSESRQSPTAAPPPKGSGAYAMRGQCTGRLVINPGAGRHNNGVRHTVTIDPPASARVARVTSTNRGCRNCALGKIGKNVWRGDFWYRCSGRGIVPISYAAYDAAGKLICSGNGSALCLGH